MADRDYVGCELQSRDILSNHKVRGFAEPLRRGHEQGGFTTSAANNVAITVVSIHHLAHPLAQNVYYHCAPNMSFFLGILHY